MLKTGKYSPLIRISLVGCSLSMGGSLTGRSASMKTKVPTRRSNVPLSCVISKRNFYGFFVCEPHRSEGGNVRPKDFKRLGQTQVRILRQALTAWLLFSISVLIKFRSHHALFNVLIRTWHVVSDSFLSFLQILNNNKNCKGQFTHSGTHTQLHCMCGEYANWYWFV